MPEVIATCSHLLVDGYDLSGQLTEVIANRSSESLDVSTMGTSTRKHKGGVMDATITAKGFLNFGSSLLDPVLFAGLGTDGVVTMFTNGIPNVACSTSGGYGMAAVSIKNQVGAAYGAVVPFDFEAQSQSAMSPAVVLDNTLSTAWGSSGAWSTGATANMGAAVPLSTNGWNTSESLYGAFHVITLSTGIVNTAVDGAIVAASSSGFASVTTLISFASRTCKGGAWGTPVPAASLSTDRPFIRSQIGVTTGTSTGSQATGIIWAGMI